MILSARTELDNHGAGGVGRACRAVRGQRESRVEDKVVFAVESDEGRADRASEAKRKRRLQLIGTVCVEERGLTV